MKSTKSLQGERILKALIEAEGRFVSMPTLSRIGSGADNGWTASFTKRISELRAAGHNIITQDNWVGGKRLTAYALIKPMTQQFFLKQKVGGYLEVSETDFENQVARAEHYA